MLTEREQALAGPRDMKEPGSAAWCWATVHVLKIHFERRQLTKRDWNKVLEEIKQHRVWEKVPPERPYGSLDALLEAEIGLTEAQSYEAVADWAQIFDEHSLAPRGKRGKGQKRVGASKSFSTAGTTNEYLTARIARDHAEVHKRMKAGEFKSVQAAAIAAGILKPQIKIRVDPKSAARIIRKHFTPDQVRELIAELTRAEK